MVSSFIAIRILGHHLPVLTYIDYICGTAIFLPAFIYGFKFKALSLAFCEAFLGRGMILRLGHWDVKKGRVPRGRKGCSPGPLEARWNGYVEIILELDGSFNVFVFCLNGYKWFIYTYNYVYI